MKTITQSTDTELVQAFQQGDNNAFETLVNRHKDKIFTSVSILVKDRYLAEDLFQEVFIKIINKLRSNSYIEEGKFLPWAIRIAHNLCLDHLRKVKRTPAIITSGEHDIFEEMSAADGADTVMMKSQRHKGVCELIDMLPKEQREVIVLRHYADLSFREIAEMANTNINTALGRMRYGLLNMKKFIAEKQIAI